MDDGCTGDGGGTDGGCGVSTRATERKRREQNQPLAYDIRKRKRVWTVVSKGSSLTTNERIDLSRNAGDDIIVVDIKRRGEKMIRIVNISDQKAREIGERPARRLDW